MGLEIDITSQFIPNIASIVIQLLSTLVIFLVAKKYLFKHVRAYLDQRAQKMMDDMESAKTKHQEALKYLDESQESLKQARQNAVKIIEDAKKMANNLQQEATISSKQKAQEILAKANAQIEMERTELRKEMGQEIVDVALNVSAKFLNQHHDKIAKDSLNRILEELRDEKDSQ